LAVVLLLFGCGAFVTLSAVGSSVAQEHRKGVKKGSPKGVPRAGVPGRPQAGPVFRGRNPAAGPGGVNRRAFVPGRFNRPGIGPNGANPRAANIRGFNARGLPPGVNGRGGNPGGQNSRFSNNRFGNSRFGNSRLGNNRFGNNRFGNNRFGNNRFGNNSFGNNRFGNRALGNNRAALRATLAGRQQLRIDHRRELVAVRGRLQSRPLPGQRGFTGVPPAGERRFRTTEMMFEVGPNVSQQAIDVAARRLGLTTIGAQDSGITGGRLYHFRLGSGRPVGDVVRALENERIGVAQPNYVYQLLQSEASLGQTSTSSPNQYVVSKLQLDAVHKLATGQNVRVAVIDSQVDARHPDLAGAIVDQFDAVGRVERPHVHATGMAGAIAAHMRLQGIAPGARILAVHAFSTELQQSPEATTQNILAGIDWAIAKGARVINMSFAGPYDPMLALAMKNAHDKGVVLIAAVGNAGPKSPPLYPAADPNVIAVTATDENDRLFAQANQGPQVAVAAPGVDIVEPAPGNTYQITTGTSVAAAHVSGVAALLIERHPDVDAQTILEVLTESARKVDGKDRDDQYGWGLIDPESALEELDTRVADGKVASTSKPAATPPASISAR
jgi:hypothetical protein